MKHLIIFIPMLLFILISSQSQAQKDPKATAVLDDVSKKYTQLASFKIEFSRNLINEEAGVFDELPGVIFVKKNLFKLEILDRSLFFDGQFIRTYDHDTQEYTISTPEEEEQELNISSILNLYKKDFDYKISKQDATGYLITLIPQKEGQSFHKIEMNISNKSEINSFTYYEKNGNLVSTIVKSFDESPNLKSSFFNFFKANLEVIDSVDMR